MPYTFISHGREHLEITTDDNQRFRFGVERNERGEPTIVCKGHWKGDLRIETRGPVSQDAAKFASICARDFGLM